MIADDDPVHPSRRVAAVLDASVATPTRGAGIEGPLSGPPTPPGRITGGLARRAMWSFGGQFLSSAGNFVVTVLALSVASRSDFAVFSVCLTSYLFLVLVLRALVSIPVTLLYSGPRDHSDDDSERAALGVGVAASLLASLAVVLVGLAFDTGRSQFAILALGLPGLCFQDCVRYVAFARGTPAVAAASDGVWLTLQLVASLALLTADRATPGSLLAAWTAAGCAAGMVAACRLHLWPDFSGAFGWFRRHSQLWRRLLLECLITSGGFYAIYYGLVAVSGADQLGHLKAAQTLIGPVSVLLMGGAALGVPESVRTRGDGPRLRRFTLRLSGALVAVTLVCGVVVFVTLPYFGPHLFPAAWRSARPLLPLLVLFNVFLGASTGPMSSIRALGATDWILRARTASTAGLLAIGLPAARLIGANGALLGLAVTESLLALAAWRQFHRLLGRASGRQSVA